MLRILLGEPPRENGGVLAEAMDNMAKLAAMLRKEMNAHEDHDHEYRKLEIWTRGLISSWTSWSKAGSRQPFTGNWLLPVIWMI